LYLCHLTTFLSLVVAVEVRVSTLVVVVVVELVDTAIL
jgi:hypothetical protein